MKTSYSRKKSPMKQKEEFEMISTLKESISENRKVEDARQSLALRSDFNALDAFR